MGVLALLAEGLGYHELATLAIGAFAFLLSIVVAMVGWWAREAIGDLKALRNDLSNQRESIAVLKASTIKDRVDELEANHASLSERVNEIASDVKVIRSIVEDERRP